MSLLAAAADLALLASEAASPPASPPLRSAWARRRSFLMTAFFWHERNIGDAAAPPPSPVDQGSGRMDGEESQLWATVVQVATQKSEAIATSSVATSCRVFIPSNLQPWSSLFPFTWSNYGPCHFIADIGQVAKM